MTFVMIFRYAVSNLFSIQFTRLFVYKTNEKWFIRDKPTCTLKSFSIPGCTTSYYYTTYTLVLFCISTVSFLSHPEFF